MAIGIERLKELKVYRRRNLNKKHRTSVLAKITLNSYKKESQILDRTTIEIRKVLNHFGFLNLSYLYSEVDVPATFSLIENYDQSFKALQNFIGAIVNNIGQFIEIDLSKCKHIDTSVTFIMQVIRFEIGDIVKKRSIGFKYLQHETQFDFIPSKYKNVNRHLLLSGLLTREKYDSIKKDAIDDEQNDKFEPIYRTGYYKGTKSQKHYFENKKGIITTNIVNYLNQCLKKHDSSLNKLGQSSLEGILSEILNNAEDHGVFNTWYVTANFSQESSKSAIDEDLVGEMNLSILNFGKSMYEGLIENRDDNYNMFSELIQAKANLELECPKHGFSDDNLFTLYALQDGTSRLKFLDESRGTGTIKFLTSFLHLGDFEDKSKGYIPQLCIITGKTILICDNNYKPFDNGGVYLLTLNPEKNLRHAPKKTHLRELSDYFPGTLLNVHLYLSKDHLSTKINSD
jgi:hypothetical protein